MRTFEQVKDKYNLTDTKFPHSQNGRRLAAWEVFTLQFYIILLSLIGVFKIIQLGTSMLINELKINNNEYVNIAIKYLKYIENVNVIDIIIIVSKYMFIFLLILLLLHLINSIKRMRKYERKPFINDHKSNALKSRLLSSLQIKQKLKNASKKRSELTTSSSKSNADSLLAIDTEINALNLVKKCLVTINTRQATDAELVYTFARCEITNPHIAVERDKLQNLTNNLQSELSFVSNNTFQFGQREIASDLSSFSYNARKLLVQAQAVKHVDNRAEETFESSFPSSLFISHEEEIQAISSAAEKWAKSTAEALNKLLSSKNESVSYVSYIVGAASVIYKYQLQFSLDVKSVNGLGENLDQLLRIKGSSAYIESGGLEIIIPLPNTLASPLDVPTLYKEAFGKGQ